MKAENKKHIGHCAICGKETVLSFEHIPPRSAFNGNSVKVLTGDSLINRIGDASKSPWDMDGIFCSINQRGSGRYSLCEDCNNKTGDWYGKEYVRVARDAAQAVAYSKTHGINEVTLKNIYPLRFVKQVLSMFCSVNAGNTNMQPIRDFVLDKKAVGIPKEHFKLNMFFTNSGMARQYPFSAAIAKGPDDGVVQLFSEIDAAPFGFVLYYDPNPVFLFQGFDISSLANYGYDDSCNVIIPFLLYEINNLLPLDYRTKEELIEAMVNDEEENNN